MSSVHLFGMDSQSRGSAREPGLAAGAGAGLGWAAIGIWTGTGSSGSSLSGSFSSFSRMSLDTEGGHSSGSENHYSHIKRKFP